MCPKLTLVFVVGWFQGSRVFFSGRLHGHDVVVKVLFADNPRAKHEVAVLKDLASHPKCPAVRLEGEFPITTEHGECIAIATRHLPVILGTWLPLCLTPSEAQPIIRGLLEVPTELR